MDVLNPLRLVITNAGIAAFTRAQLGEDIDLRIATVGFTAASFYLAPTLTALPGEFKRLDTLSGTVTGPDTVHLLVRDATPETYSVRGFGLFLADGTLFAVYGQAVPLVEKAGASMVLLALDLRFPAEQVAAISFGDANFVNPPATETVQGVARVATQAQVDAGTADECFVSPQKLKHLLPLGAVMMWWGAAAAVPSGWAICDGRKVQRSDGAGEIATPDLRDRAVVGAGGARNLGDAFGATSRTVDTSDAGAHTPAGKLPSHAHGVNLNTAQAQSGVTLNTTMLTETARGGNGVSVATASLTDPGHAHGVAGNTAGSGDLALSMDAVPAHKHQATIDVTQPSFALFFIMRI